MKEKKKSSMNDSFARWINNENFAVNIKTFSTERRKAIFHGKDLNYSNELYEHTLFPRSVRMLFIFSIMLCKDVLMEKREVSQLLRDLRMKNRLEMHRISLANTKVLPVVPVG